MQPTNTNSAPDNKIDLHDVYRRYLAVLEFERSEVCSEYGPGPERDQILDCYRPVPFERFEMAMLTDDKLSGYLVHLERFEFAMREPSTYL